MDHGYIGEVIGHIIFEYYGGSFGSLLGHFTCFFKGLGLPSMVQFVAMTFLGC
jgi:hypothetical protein